MPPSPSKPPISPTVDPKSQEIAAKVEKASESFKTLQGDISKIISTLKEQKTAMEQLSDKRLQTVQLLDKFVNKTPLAHVVSGDCESSSRGRSEEKPEAAPTEEHDKENQPEIPEEKGLAGNTEQKEEENAGEPHEEAKDEAKEEEEKNSSPTDEEAEPAEAMEEEKEETEVVEEKQEEKEEAQEEEEPPKVETLKAELSPSSSHDSNHQQHPFYLEVHKSVHGISSKFTSQYQTDIIGYATNWLKTVSDRIGARQLQLQELKSSYEHYTTKLSGLERKKASPGRKQDRLERNQLKLKGAQEAYDNAGESLLVLLEEVTERAWVDIYPLVRKHMQFDCKYNKSLGEAFGELTLDSLQHVAETFELMPAGRLEDLEKMHPEELYRGTKHVVRPVVGSTKFKEDASF